MHASVSNIAASLLLAAGPAVAATCYSGVNVFTARGSFEQPPNGLGIEGTHINAILAAIPNSNATVIDYPATFTNNSVPIGVQNGTRQLTAYLDACPTSKVVVAGYSQGAVTQGYVLTGGDFTINPEGQSQSYTVPPLAAKYANQIVAVVFWGDPYFNLNIGLNSDAPYPCKVSSSNPRSASGPFGAYASRLQEWCNYDDLYCCGTGTSFNGHISYFSADNATITGEFVKGKYNAAIGGSSSSSSSASKPVAPTTFSSSVIKPSVGSSSVVVASSVSKAASAGSSAAASSTKKSTPAYYPPPKSSVKTSVVSAKTSSVATVKTSSVASVKTSTASAKASTTPLSTPVKSTTPITSPVKPTVISSVVTAPSVVVPSKGSSSAPVVIPTIKTSALSSVGVTIKTSVISSAPIVTPVSSAPVKTTGGVSSAPVASSGPAKGSSPAPYTTLTTKTTATTPAAYPTISLPTITLPALPFPTFAIPTLTLPKFTFPTIAFPTIKKWGN